MFIKIIILITLIILSYILIYTLIKKYMDIHNIKKETFIGVLEVLSDTFGGNNKKETEINSIINKEKIEVIDIPNYKYIYISKKGNNDILPLKYKFYNKKYNNYMVLYTNKVNIELYDINDKIIGKKLNEKHNNYTFQMDLFNGKNIYFEIYNYYNNVKIYIDNDDKYFYIKNMDDKYDIYLFSKKIGKIIYKDDIYSYKIIIMEDYKKYINLFGIGFILLQ